MKELDKKLLFSIDVEADGLYGETFAVGVTVWELFDGLYPIDSFQGIAELVNISDEWVKENIAPLVRSLPVYETRKQLRDAFWEFYMKYRETAVMLADFAVPCEGNFFQQCILDDKNNRAFKGPYPLHDLGTQLYVYGVDPDIDRLRYSDLVGDPDIKRHNPTDDSIMAAKIFLKLIKAGTLTEKEYYDKLVLKVNR
jgi:hypothetical protein